MKYTHGISVTALVAFIIGSSAGFFFGNQRGHENGYRIAHDDINKMLIERGVLDKAPENLHLIKGTVKAIEESQGILRIEVPQIISNPLEPQSPTERIIHITENTAVLQRISKADGELAREWEGYYYAIENLKDEETPPLKPLHFIEKPIYINDIAPDDVVIIESNDNFLYKKNFDVSRIIVTEHENQEEARGEE